ncbi:methyl-accepting chemotaxis protein [Pseudoalteromonas sp. SS15]|uniref:methyl-accepting chemotaxis protein n=1 Tax=Pseudoalteromonas sp. SS15 TaxID=3139393 RepID=UPI003BAAAFB8
MSRKLVIAIFITIFAIFLFVTIALANYLAEQRSAQVQSQINTQMQASAEQIEQFFENKITALHTLFRAPSNLAAIKARQMQGELDSNVVHLNAALTAQSSADKEVLSIFFGSAFTGEYMFEKGIYTKDGYSVFGRPWWEDIKRTQNTVISEVLLHPEFKQNYAAINFPVLHQGEFLGVGGADILLPSISQFVDKLNFQGEGVALLADAKGRLIHLSGDHNFKLSQLIVEFDNSARNSGFRNLFSTRSDTLQTLLYNDTEYYAATLKVQSDAFDLGWHLALLVPKQVVNEPVNQAVYQLIVLSVLLMVILSVLVGVITKKLCQPLTLVQLALEQIAAGNGDLTKRIEVKGQDETARVGLAVNQIIAHLQEMVQQIVVSTQELDAAINYVDGLTQESDKMNRTMLQSMQTTASAVSELATSAQSIQSQANNAQQAVSAANDMAAQGQLMIKDNQQELAVVAEQFSQANSVMSQLRDESDNISEVLNVIKSVAEQTNLLALNAAIEAARAGENGRGFAVVADEVRQLAARSESSTNQIQAIIEQLQTSSETASTMMQHATEQLQAFESHSDKLNAAFADISQQVSLCVSANGEITDQVSAQAQTSAELDQVLHSLEQTVEQQIKGSTEIASCQTQLANSSKGLYTLVGSFKVQ